VSCKILFLKSTHQNNLKVRKRKIPAMKMVLGSLKEADLAAYMRIDVREVFYTAIKATETFLWQHLLCIIS
jgi:hypothetical protein